MKVLTLSAKAALSISESELNNAYVCVHSTLNNFYVPLEHLVLKLSIILLYERFDRNWDQHRRIY